MNNIYTIYKATNIINGKSYIGFDSNWPKRKGEHKRQIKYIHHAFQRAIKKYGWESFEWTILYQSKDRNHTLNEMETYFIKEYNTYAPLGCGYNMTMGGEGTNGYKRPDLIEYNKKLKGIKKNPHLRKMNSMRITCQYCGIICSLGNYKRWHDVKCKNKN